MSTKGNKFMPCIEPGVYAVFHTDGTTRVPGTVTVSQNLPRVFTYQRELPAKGKKPKLVSFTGTSVRELSEKIDQYFSNDNKETSQ